MKRDYAVNLFLVLTLSSIALCSVTPTRKRPWLAVRPEDLVTANKVLNDILAKASAN
jgi:hypothetical protein